MLEVLTESEDTKEGRQRVANILDEQKKTLKFAMSRPQVCAKQFFYQQFQFNFFSRFNSFYMKHIQN